MHSWKFAANAVWEEALEVDASKPIDTAAIEQWVAQSPQNIAFEAVFADEKGEAATMFGVRLTSLPKAEQIVRLKKLASKTDLIKTEADFQKIAAEIFPEFNLFPGKPEALNIGIINQWYSVGEEIIWNRQSKVPLTLGELKEKAPRFFEPTRNPAAVEFWYTAPDHWYKMYVSDPQDGGYLINPAKYQAAVGRLAKPNGPV